MKGRLIMFCQNCGNKLDESACVCINCGVLLRKRSEVRMVKDKGDINATGAVSIVLGVIAIVLSLMLFFQDISSVGMYTEVYERVFFTLEYSLPAILLSSATLILSWVGKRSNYSNIGLVLSMLSFFFIITEVIVVIIY